MCFSGIEEVRDRIDHIDRELVKLIAQRAACVKAAAAFKTDSHAVREPARVEQVIAKVRARAAEEGLSADIIEEVYRSMIAAFIDYELNQHQQAQQRKN